MDLKNIFEMRVIVTKIITTAEIDAAATQGMLRIYDYLIFSRLRQSNKIKTIANKSQHAISIDTKC